MMFYVIIICIFLIASPFYIFPSGVPQPADIILILGGGLFLLDKEKWKVFKLPIFRYLIPIFLLICVINITYWFIYYSVYGIENRMYYPPLFYIFNLIFVSILSYVLTTQNYKKHTNIIAYAVLGSLIIQFLIAIFGISGGSTNGQRAVLFFNNPNQLGYFSLAMLSFFFVLPSKLKKNIFLILIAIFTSSYLILYSGSRAALGGVVILSIYIIYKEGFRLNAKSILLLFMFAISLPFVLKTEVLKASLSSIEQRNERHTGSNVSQFEIRGYDRIYNNPEYIILGAGEGMNERFKSYHQLEIHSGLGTMLFSYGILGLTLLLNLIYKSVRNNIIYSLMIILPIMTYNLTHNGLRESLLWGVVSVLFIINSPMTKSNKIKRSS